MRGSILLLALMAATAFADDGVLRLDGMTLRGIAEGERPKVQYLHDWKPPAGTGRLYEGLNSYNVHWFEPVTRDSLQREVRYRQEYAVKKPTEVKGDDLER